METNVSQTYECDATIRSGYRLPLWTRLLVAAPGSLAAAVMFAGGVYLVVLGVGSPMRADEDFASIPAAVSVLGIAACVFGLLIALAVLAVTLRRVRRVPLILAAVFAGGSAVLAAYLLATGADRIVYVPLFGVLAYLAVVAILRLAFTQRPANA